jgi:hypothetical protein
MTAPDLIADRAAARAARIAARRLRRGGRPDPDDVTPDRATRRARRRHGPAPMVGWVTPDGDAVPQPDPAAVPLPPGWVATTNPADGGVITPTVRCSPGLPYVVAATLTGPQMYAGLQWINLDGTADPDVAWVAGPGRVTVTAAAPDTAAGVRPLIARYTRNAAVLAGRDPTTRVLLLQLRRWLRDD